MLNIRDRVIELRKIPASELIENPKNWRKHPPSQRSAMAGALNEIGLADAVIARETPEGLELIDGHLRQEVLGDTPVPVLVAVALLHREILAQLELMVLEAGVEEEVHLNPLQEEMVVVAVQES